MPWIDLQPGHLGFDAPVSMLHQHNLDWFGTVRGRLGAAVTPQVLAYATGGLPTERSSTSATCMARASTPWPIPSRPATNSSAASCARMDCGRGIEARLIGNVTGKIEYLHVDFGTDFAPGELCSERAHRDRLPSPHHQDLVRIGLNQESISIGGAYKVATSELREQPRPIYKAPFALAWTWTGFYFGANAGYAIGAFNSEAVFSDASVGTRSLPAAPRRGSRRHRRGADRL